MRGGTPRRRVTPIRPRSPPWVGIEFLPVFGHRLLPPLQQRIPLSLPANGANGWSVSGTSTDTIRMPTAARDATCCRSFCSASSGVAPSALKANGSGPRVRYPFPATGSISTGMRMTVLRRRVGACESPRSGSVGAFVGWLRSLTRLVRSSAGGQEEIPADQCRRSDEEQGEDDGKGPDKPPGD